MKKTSISNDFFEQVWETVKQIPEGRVTSYGAIARFLGAASSSRVVGYALNSLGNDKKHGVPAHRVVNRNGLITGKFHFKSVSMEELLAREGVLVKDNKIVDFENIFWDPESLVK
ncbi:MAG: MGMT family protein [Bacteroidetes bacterium]|nr:MGMT family protein [Bacteroidota bacterium]